MTVVSAAVNSQACKGAHSLEIKTRSNHDILMNEHLFIMFTACAAAMRLKYGQSYTPHLQSQNVGIICVKV